MKQTVALWHGNRKPTLSTERHKTDITIYGGNFDTPVWVELRTGEVFAIPENKWERNGNTCRFLEVPVYDSPVLVLDQSLIKMKESRE
jgi:hypothetical protein